MCQTPGKGCMCQNIERKSILEQNILSQNASVETDRFTIFEDKSNFVKISK